MKVLKRGVASVLVLLVSAAVWADTTLLAPEAFLRETFGDAAPKPQVLWLDDAAQVKLKIALGHAYPQARLRYWRAAGKTAWILDEIGKEYPITAGFVVIADHAQHSVDSARVLIYRESRGDEVRYPAFLKQFQGAQLHDEQLDKSIDGISGATLAVGAMRRMAQAALVLDALAAEPAAAPAEAPAKP